MVDSRKQLDKEMVVALLEQYGKQVIISKQPDGMQYELTVIPPPRISKRDRIEAVELGQLRRASVGWEPSSSIGVIFVYKGKEPNELDAIMTGEEVIADKTVPPKRKTSTTTRSNPNTKKKAV